MSHLEPLQHQTMPLQRSLERTFLRVRGQSVEVPTVTGQCNALGYTPVLEKACVRTYARLAHLQLLSKIIERRSFLVQQQGTHESAGDPRHPLLLEMPPEQLNEFISLTHFSFIAGNSENRPNLCRVDRSVNTVRTKSSVSCPGRRVRSWIVERIHRVMMSPAYDGGRRSKVSTSERDGEGHAEARMHSVEGSCAAGGQAEALTPSPRVPGDCWRGEPLGREGFRRRRSNVGPPRRAYPQSRLSDA